MKSRILILSFVTIASLTILTSGGAKKEISMDEAMDAVSGIWINPDYSPQQSTQKLVVYPKEGMIKYYHGVDVTLDTPAIIGGYTINEAWIDQKGNIWLKTTIKRMDGTKNQLNKISNSGGVWEYVWSYGDLPDDIESDSPKYKIWYRL
jgi:hypothetical protein